MPRENGGVNQDKWTVKESPCDPEFHSFCGFISGLVAGEGCFMLRMHTRTNSRNKTKWRVLCEARFIVTLRSDDIEVLETMRKFFGCGSLRARPVNRGANPQAFFTVSSVPALHEIICPFFEKFPLRSKKEKDFCIWKKAVAMMYEVQHRSGMPKWRRSDFDMFSAMCKELKDVRVYRVPEGTYGIDRDLLQGIGR